MEIPSKISKIGVVSLLTDTASARSLIFSDENLRDDKSNIYKSNDTFRRKLQKNHISQVSLSTGITNRLYVPSEKTVSHIQAERESQYFGRTPGPGQYQVIKPIGSNEIISRKKNPQSFTIRKRNDMNNKQLLVTEKKEEIT